MNSNQSGFTIVEIIVCIAVISIVATIAMPYFNQAMAAQESQRIPSLLKLYVNKARQTAVIYRNNVVICPTTNLNDCSQDWNTALLMFIDLNRNRQHDTNEQILEHTHLELKYGQLTWRGALGMQTIALKPSAGAALGSMGSFYYCAQHGQQHKKILVNKMANARIEDISEC